MDIDEAEELLRSAKDEMVHEVTTELNNIIIEAAKKTPPLLRKSGGYAKKKSRIEGYTKECWMKRQEYYRAKNRNNIKKDNKWCKKERLIRKNLAKLIIKVKNYY